MTENLPNPTDRMLEDATDRIWTLTKDRPNPKLPWLNERSVPLSDGSNVTIGYTKPSTPRNRVSVALEIPSGGKITKSWDKLNPSEKSKQATSIPLEQFSGEGQRQVETRRPFDEEDLIWINTQLDHFTPKEGSDG